MFNILYRCPRTVARHENGPLHESRRRCLEQVAAQGAALHTLRGAAGIIYRAAIWMKLDESSPVERKEVERAAKRWAHRSYRNASCRESLGKFFKHTRVHQLFKLKIADVERFLALLGKQGWTRHGMRSMAHQLRLFSPLLASRWLGRSREWQLRFTVHVSISTSSFRSVPHGRTFKGSWPVRKTNRKVDIRKP